MMIGGGVTFPFMVMLLQWLLRRLLTAAWAQAERELARPIRRTSSVSLVRMGSHPELRERAARVRGLIAEDQAARAKRSEMDV
jgi:hypothetical protein